jgi:gamma-glutamyltranspeptidase/glutathione hydrolase
MSASARAKATAHDHGSGEHGRRGGSGPRLGLTPALAVVLALAAAAGGTRAQDGVGAGNWPFPSSWRFSPDDVASARGRAGVVASTDRVASEIGAEVLRRGGNAFDAAVAVHMALAVVNPEAGNLGGGGFLVARTADGETLALDFRETAPASATRDMFRGARGGTPGRSVRGHLASGTPGSVRGMWEAHRRAGSLPWRELLAPAVALAEGVVVHDRLASSFARAGVAVLGAHPAARRVFLPAGAPLRVGERLVQRDLAATLRRIARGGANGFYRGVTARLIAAEMRRGGGLVTERDLAEYRAVWRQPVRIRYRDVEVIGMSPPSSGGVAVGELLGMLERLEAGEPGGRPAWRSVRHLHLWAEAARRTFADRNALVGDPDFADVPVSTLVSAEYLDARAASVDRARASRSADVGPGLPVPSVRAVPSESAHTTHYSVVDARGNAVAVTTTINSLYGSGVLVTGAGFFLNDEMDDFTTEPGAPNQFGLMLGEVNAIAPRKRMLSAMSPTVVTDATSGRVRMVVGSPGGPTIVTTVAQVIEAHVGRGLSPRAAIAAPRLHHQHVPDVLWYERGGLPTSTVEALRALGHDVRERNEAQPLQGDVQAVFVDDEGVALGVSDPRRGGAPVAVVERVGAVH